MAKRKKQIRKNKERKGILNYLKKKSDIRKIKWGVFIACLIAVFAVAGIGSFFTDTGEWYSSIKPSIAPPNYVFPIVWSLIFYLIAVSLYYSWLSMKKERVIVYYGINFILNILWSYLYFGMKNPGFAFLEILVLWFSIVFLIGFNWKKARKASYFLIPYLLWVSFAVVLNYLSIK